MKIAFENSIEGFDNRLHFEIYVSNSNSEIIYNFQKSRRSSQDFEDLLFKNSIDTKIFLIWSDDPDKLKTDARLRFEI